MTSFGITTKYTQTVLFAGFRMGAAGLTSLHGLRSLSFILATQLSKCETGISGRGKNGAV